MTRIIRARLEGRDARLGDVLAADVARLILGLERALARASYVALGTSRGSHGGRHRSVVERASRLRFVGVERGSLIELLALPDFTEPTLDELPMAVGDLSGAAFEQLVRAIAGTGDVDAELAAAVAQLCDELGIGERNDHLSLAEAGEDPRLEPAHAVLIDVRVRDRMRTLAQRPASLRDDAVLGTLVEADFERHTARIQPPVGGAVVVTFSEEMADDIYRALRQPTQLQGVVRFDPTTAAAREIELHGVTRANQLAFDSRAFFINRTVEELAAEQGVRGPVTDAADLSDPELTDAERLAFLAPLIDA